MPFTQQLCDRRDGLRMRGRELAQIDFLAGPAGPHRRQRSNHAGIWIKSAQRVGLTTCRAAGVEQEIVKVPKNEIVVTFGPPQAIVASGVDLEKDLAIHQQGKKLDPRKTVLPTQPFDLLRCRQHGDGGGNLRIAKLEQRGGARRFQDHRVAAPPQVREPRQDESVGIAELWRSRPIIGSLRFDDEEVIVLCRAPQAVLQQTTSGQSPDQQIDLLVDVSAAGGKRGKWQTRAQVLRAIRRARAELSQADRIALETGGDFAVRARLRA